MVGDTGIEPDRDPSYTGTSRANEHGESLCLQAETLHRMATGHRDTSALSVTVTTLWIARGLHDEGAPMAGAKGHRGFGSIRKLPSRRYQASYVGPDLVRHTAPTTFDDKDTAVVWLSQERRLIESDTWSSPKVRAHRDKTSTFEAYAEAWLAHRPLKPRTRAGYRRLLDGHILPTFGATPVRQLTPEFVRAWFAARDPKTPTQNAHAYALLKAICQTAVEDDLLMSGNPCRIRGAGQARRASRTTTATPAQITSLIAEMPERYRAMTALAGWCGLRYGETIELRRKDIDLKAEVVHVRRAASLVDRAFVVGTPKTDAGIRTVVIPPHVLPILKSHLSRMPVAGHEALLFPAAHDPTKHLRSASLCKVFYPARERAGLPKTFRWHDLRHSVGSIATSLGATLPDVMAMLGHSTPGAAMRYQHQVNGRAADIAAALSQAAVGD